MQSASAAGFYISEFGTPGSLGSAGVANPTNTFGADAAWTNPAGMTGLDEDRIYAGMQVVVPKVEFDSSFAGAGGSDGGNAGEVAAIPSFFYVKKLSDRARFGFSITAPMGGGMDYGDDFVGRYAVTSVEMGSISFAPSFGYRVNDRLSIGGGVSIIYTLMEQEIAINQSAVPAPDGKVKFEDLDDWGYQPFLGLTYQLSDRTLLGVVYRAEAAVELEGDVKFSGLVIPALPIGEVTMEWDNPQWLQVGLRHQLTDKDTLFFNVGWQEWSAFSENRLTFTGAAVAVVDHEWDNTWHAGIAYGHHEAQWSWGVGFSYDSSPVDDEDRVVELVADETYKLSTGFVWEGKNKLRYGLGATLLIVGDGKIDQTSQGVRVIGEFDKNYVLFLGATLRYVF